MSVNVKANFWITVLYTIPKLAKAIFDDFYLRSSSDLRTSPQKSKRAWEEETSVISPTYQAGEDDRLNIQVFGSWGGGD